MGSSGPFRQKEVSEQSDFYTFCDNMLALKKKMEAKNTAATQPTAPATAADGQTKQTSGQFQLSKQPSKDLADLRAKNTGTTGVFGLAKKNNKGAAAGQKSAAELRAQKGTRFGFEL